MKRLVSELAVLVCSIIVIYKQQKFLTVPKAVESQIMRPVDSVSGEGFTLLDGHFLTLASWEEGSRVLTSVSFSRALILFRRMT